jgi:prevent-host-death family protein
MVWTLQEAKNKFSQVVENALRDGPQSVTRNGKEAVVIVSAEEWRKKADEEQSLADFLLDSPLRDSGLALERDRSPVRPVEL